MQLPPYGGSRTLQRHRLTGDRFEVVHLDPFGAVRPARESKGSEDRCTIKKVNSQLWVVSAKSSHERVIQAALSEQYAASGNDLVGGDAAVEQPIDEIGQLPPGLADDLDGQGRTFVGGVEDLDRPFTEPRRRGRSRNRHRHWAPSVASKAARSRLPRGSAGSPRSS